ncbi:MAG: KpsF/GutQ family sugar-phosphate isomerase [Planctomycetota bacterium]|nr:KpsF/GutQ family sugar-phosphate isomerase [Planctomycetota bacterium]
MSDSLQIGREVIEQEARALQSLAAGLGDAFQQAVRLLVEAPGRVLVSGVGKSGSIAQKVAGTLASTGTPALFLHPIEALHGDLGIVGDGDILLALSKSGQTEELVRFLGHFRRVGGAVISICEDANSPAARLSDVVVEIPALGEAGPLSLAPTTSSVLQLAVADALAMSLLDARGFTEEQFASFHPEGTLGRRLLVRCEDLLHEGDALPLVDETQSVADLLVEMSGKGLGMACVVDSDGKYIGVFTDGDLRRLLTRSSSPVDLPISEAWKMSRRESQEAVPDGTVAADGLAVDALAQMRAQEITCLVILKSDQSPRGVVRLADLVREGIVEAAGGP